MGAEVVSFVCSKQYDMYDIITAESCPEVPSRALHCMVVGNQSKQAGRKLDHQRVLLTAYLGSMKGSLTATISTSSCSMALRKTIRPIRPNPLMPTLIAMFTDLLV